MEIRTQTTNTEAWLGASKGIKITAFTQNYVPTLSISGMPLPAGNCYGRLKDTGVVMVAGFREHGSQIRRRVAESLERSLDEHADVWSELAKH